MSKKSNKELEQELKNPETQKRYFFWIVQGVMSAKVPDCCKWEAIKQAYAEANQ